MYGRIIPVGEINTRKAAAKVEYTTFIARGNDLWVKWRFCCAYLYSFRIETRGENETKFSYLHLKFIVESIIYSILDFKLFLGKFFNCFFFFLSRSIRFPWYFYIQNIKFYSILLLNSIIIINLWTKADHQRNTSYEKGCEQTCEKLARIVVNTQRCVFLQE